ncbi:secreted protein [Beggiatoa sp. PS]|nr:secreted protein [Beggiatoa sp. PS]
MKTLLTFFISTSLFSCFIPFSTFAIHDITAINIIPTNHQVQFCFDLDTRKLYLDKMYVAAITEEGSLFTIKPTSDSFTLHDLSTNPAPIFSEWHKDSEPICLGSF